VRRAAPAGKVDTMATILVLGAALGGLQTALLLAADGHDVTSWNAMFIRRRRMRNPPGRDGTVPASRSYVSPTSRSAAGSSRPRPIWQAWWDS
jgi:2-polyprenyl-6-methoxyphenol hydroxylase-like FAD-dependent oxidoreductase